MVKYSIEETSLKVSEEIFSPIEFLDWECLTVGALGWGQIQIANSNNIKMVPKYSRKKWMLQLCDVMMTFYPREIEKISERIQRFDSVRQHWHEREDTWTD